MTATLTPTGTYARVAHLPLRIDGYALAPLELRLNDVFTRLSTVVRLRGGGLEGRGEDTTYAPPDQLTFRAAGSSLPLAGEWTLETFSAHLGRLELCPGGMSQPDFARFRRWAFESAALDLALRQAGLSLAAALGRKTAPVTFVVSPGPETTAATIRERLAADPGLRFKLMATPAWDEAWAAELAATGAIDVVDLKGCYDESVPIAVRPEPGLYARVLRAFPRAWIEDPGVTRATAPVLQGHMDRVTWDAPIRCAADIIDRRPRPRMVNMKPSRFGTVRAVLDAYEACARVGIGTYGGGQFELGPGRPQIQALASLFSPGAPNDVAPAAYNEPVARPGLPTSPLSAPADLPGFG